MRPSVLGQAVLCLEKFNLNNLLKLKGTKYVINKSLLFL